MKKVCINSLIEKELIRFNRIIYINKLNVKQLHLKRYGGVEICFKGN